MTLSSALLLLSALLHATWNAYTKKTEDKESLLLSMTLVSVFVTSILIFVSGSYQLPISSAALFLAVLSGIFEGLYMAALSRSLRTTSLGKAYAIMRGGAMIVVWSFSLLFLNETTNLIHGIGAVIVFTGIIILSLKVEKNSKISWWPFLSAVCIAGYHICYHQALHIGAHPQVIFFASMLVCMLILAASFKDTAFERVKSSFKNQTKAVFITAFMSTASFVIFLYALLISEPGYAISLRNSSIFFTLVFSYFLKEHMTNKQIIGALIVGAGTILLSLPKF